MDTIHTVDYSRLFLLDDPLADRPLRLMSRKPKQDWFSWEKAYQLFVGECQPPEPVRLQAYMGGQVAHFLWGAQPTICISQKVVDILKDNKFTGWATYPVEVYDRKGEFLPGYYGFAIPGRSGRHELGRSQVIYKPLLPVLPGEEPRKYYKGFFFDESRWDGSDIFKLEGSSHRVVKQEVQDVLKRAKITNVRLTPLLEVEIDATVYDYKKQGSK